MRKFSGFSLIELMIAVGLVAVFASLAIPSFQTLVANNRQTAQLNDMISSLNYARTEAVRRGSPVTVCSSSDFATCNGGVNWHNGWIVVFNPGIAGEEILNVYQGFEGANTLVTTGSAIARFDYQPTGFRATGAGAVTLALCDPRGLEFASQIQISPSGRPAADKTPPGACS